MAKIKDNSNKKNKNTFNSKSTVLIGLQYGDEGKARVMDKLLNGYDIVARFNGGPNAGHTLSVKDIKIALHQVPSGIFYKNMKLHVGSGCVVNPTKILQEIKEIESHGIKLDNRLTLSGYITLIQPHHIIFDGIYGKAIGSTKNGIGAAYSDQAVRSENNDIKNVRLADYLSNPNKFREYVENNLKHMIIKNDVKGVNIDLEINTFHNNTLLLKKYLCTDPLMIENLVSSGKNIFFEGAQSVMLDVVTGMTPYVTSSRTIAAAAYTGGDLSVKHHHKTIGVAKAIMSRVGNGPFVSEFGGYKSEKYCDENGGAAHTFDKETASNDSKKLLQSKELFDIGIAIRMLTNEYGATTKRPRRIGMLDLVMLKQNCLLNGVEEIYINKFDCLQLFSQTNLKGIPFVTSYELNGKQINYMPTSVEEVRLCKPIIKYLPTFAEDITKITDYKKLPQKVKDIIKFIEKEVGTKICGVGVGPEREQFVMIKYN
jgi:adenylosuccinate synthase